MTLDEAIERNTDLCGSPHMKGMDKSIEAVRLGIEALKSVQNSRRIGWATVGPPLLPGETEEELKDGTCTKCGKSVRRFNRDDTMFTVCFECRPKRHVI